MQLKQKDVKAERERLQAEQNNICPLCSRTIQDPCLDHDHQTGRVRSVSCRICNSAEGQIRKTLIRTGLINMLGQDGALMFLENLVDYLRKDYSEMNLHPNHIKDELKRFQKLNKDAMIACLSALSLPTTGTKPELVAVYKQHLNAA